MRETVEYPRNIKDCPHEPRFGRNARGIATDVDKRNLRNGHDGAENPDTVYRLIEQSLPPICGMVMTGPRIPTPYTALSSSRFHPERAGYGSSDFERRLRIWR